MPTNAELAEALGSWPRSEVEAPWGSKNQTSIIALLDGRELAVQRYRDREMAKHRVRAVEQLAPPLRAHGTPAPMVAASNLDAAIPWAAYERLPGEVGYVAAGDDLSSPAFPAMARSMGAVIRAFQRLDAAAFDLPTLWATPSSLAQAGLAWLEPLKPHLSENDINATIETVRGVPVLFDARPIVVAHGDFGPQNVLIVDDRVTAVLDFEDARLADPLLDPAWWAWLVRAHTPDAFDQSWPGFLETSAIDSTGEGAHDTRCFTLIVLRLLETAETMRQTRPDKYVSWACRLSATLSWRHAPLYPARNAYGAE